MRAVYTSCKTVAPAQRAGQAFYGIIQVDQILGPAPLHRPAYPWDKHKYFRETVKVRGAYNEPALIIERSRRVNEAAR